MTPEEARDVQDERKGWMDPLDVRDYLDDAVDTIAAQTWEYRIEEWGGNYWYPCEEWNEDGSMYDGYTERRGERLVRRIVGPVEVVDMEGSDT